MGARLGKDRSTIYRYENGDIENLPLDILEPIAEVLQTTPQYLMGWQEVQKNNDALTDIVVRMRKDSEFFSVVEELHQLSPEQLASIKPILAVLQKG
jgi:transcriptional regulator with XRE-family HTH domain